MKMGFLIFWINFKGFLDIFLILMFEIELGANNSLVDENGAFIFIVRNMI
jgi:hypothetical protein